MNANTCTVTACTTVATGLSDKCLLHTMLAQAKWLTEEERDRLRSELANAGALTADERTDMERRASLSDVRNNAWYLATAIRRATERGASTAEIETARAEGMARISATTGEPEPSGTAKPYERSGPGRREDTGGSGVPPSPGPPAQASAPP